MKHNILFIFGDFGADGKCFLTARTARQAKITVIVLTGEDSFRTGRRENSTTILSFCRKQRDFCFIRAADRRIRSERID